MAEMQRVIGAPRRATSFDVLAHVAYALPGRSPARSGRDGLDRISTHFNSKQQVFLAFVLSHYVRVGVEELQIAVKPRPLAAVLKYNAIADAVADLSVDPRRLRTSSSLPEIPLSGSGLTPARPPFVSGRPTEQQPNRHRRLDRPSCVLSPIARAPISAGPLRRPGRSPI